MLICPVCECGLDIEDYEFDEGEIVSCPDCGAEFEVAAVEPIELARVEEGAPPSSSQVLRRFEESGTSPIQNTEASASLAEAIINKHQKRFEQKQREVIERLAEAINSQPNQSYIEAFNESAQPDAVAPKGWWVLPVLGLLLGLLVMLWSVTVGLLIVGFMLILLVAGAYRARRNRPRPSKTG
jgi:alpha-aminoadipate carrier protein LysW